MNNKLSLSFLVLLFTLISTLYVFTSCTPNRGPSLSSSYQVKWKQRNAELDKLAKRREIKAFKEKFKNIDTLEKLALEGDPAAKRLLHKGIRVVNALNRINKVLRVDTPQYYHFLFGDKAKAHVWLQNNNQLRKELDNLVLEDPWLEEIDCMYGDDTEIALSLRRTAPDAYSLLLGAANAIEYHASKDLNGFLILECGKNSTGVEIHYGSHGLRAQVVRIRWEACPKLPPFTCTASSSKPGFPVVCQNYRLNQ